MHQKHECSARVPASNRFQSEWRIPQPKTNSTVPVHMVSSCRARPSRNLGVRAVYCMPKHQQNQIRKARAQYRGACCGVGRTGKRRKSQWRFLTAAPPEIYTVAHAGTTPSPLSVPDISYGTRTTQRCVSTGLGISRA
eukprot:1924879-Rhodomonas_salina.2